MNTHLHGAPQIVFNTSRCHDLFHAFKLHLTFSITHDAAQVSLRNLLPSGINRFHLRHMWVQFVKSISNTRQLSHTVEWSL
jgi:hypothetical protein